jgi:DNA uptake protein ComE-like DNA-binding protein
VVDFNRNRVNNRHRQQAMVMVATILILWVAIYQVGLILQGSGTNELDHPPRLFVELEAASEEELQLLPDVGPKTARAWKETLSQSLSPAARDTNDLEALPKVGPVRSARLAPFLVEARESERP